jgi:hypothetical protein
MFIYLKIGLLTCAFYLGTLLLIEAVKIALTHLWGGFSMGYSSQHTWYIFDTVFYGLIWLGSFFLARHLIWRTLHFPTGSDSHFGGPM